MIIDFNEGQITTSYLVKDFKLYKRHIVSKSSIRKRGFEAKEKNVREKNCEKINDDEEIYRLSCLRAKNAVHAMALLNKWTYMVTLTFNPEIYNSKDPEVIKKTTLNWLKNQVKHTGIKYLLVPEYHKDHKKIHWHGFIYDPNNKLKVTLSGHKSNKNYDIYNIDSWNSNKGYSTACKIDTDDPESPQRCAAYFMKYMSKDFDRICDKFYYCSNGLVKDPDIIYPRQTPDINDPKWFENDYCFIWDEKTF